MNKERINVPLTDQMMKMKHYECVIQRFKNPDPFYNGDRIECKCGSIINYNDLHSHIKTKKHIKYMELKTQEIQEIALPLPTISQEIQEIPIPDKEPEPIAEILSPVPDPVLTKAEIRKEKKKEYMRNYMRDYHTKRYNEDPVYRQYRIDMTKKSTCKMSSRYVKAYQYMKENGINIFDENGN